MKRLKKLFCVFVLTIILGLSMTSCCLNYESYAKRLNDEILDGDDVYPSYSGIMAKLGDEAIDCTFYPDSEINRMGQIVAVKGCKSREEILEKINSGENVVGIIIYIQGNVASSAKYTTITADDLTDLKQQFSDVMNGNWKF